MKHSQRSSAKKYNSPFRSPRARTGPRRPTEQITVDPAIVFEDLLPDLNVRDEGFAWACCPFHDDNNPSLCVNVRSGWYKCHSSSCGATGSNIVGFVGRLLGYEYQETRRYLEQHYG